MELAVYYYNYIMIFVTFVSDQKWCIGFVDLGKLNVLNWRVKLYFVQ